MLIALVVFIWGFIIYKLASGLSGDDIAVSQQIYAPREKRNTDTTYQLLAEEYPDPFFNEFPTDDSAHDADMHSDAQEVVGESKEESARALIQASAGVVEILPEIKYNGYIFNPVTKKKTALITYNGRAMSAGVSDKLDEKIRIVRIDSQELVVIFNGKKIVIGVSS